MKIIKNYSLIYIPPFCQNNVTNWISKTTDFFTVPKKVILLREKKIEFIELLNPKTLIFFFETIFSLITNKKKLYYSETQFLPFARFEFIQKLNKKINLFLIKFIFLRNKNIVLVTCLPSTKSFRIKSLLRPKLSVADCTHCRIFRQILLKFHRIINVF